MNMKWKVVQFIDKMSGEPKNSWDIYEGDKLIVGDLLEEEAKTLQTVHNNAIGDKDKLIRLSCEDWAEDDTAIKELAKPFGVDIEGDGYAFKGAVEVVEDLCKLLATEQKKLQHIDDYFKDQNESFMVEGNTTFERVRNYIQELDN